ncbi:RsiV family protein [Mycobacterium sp. NPDC003449]
MAAIGVAVPVAVALMDPPVAGASPESFCTDLGGEFDGHYCGTVVRSVRNANRDIRIAIPGELVDKPTTGSPIRAYLRDLYRNWSARAGDMAQDSYGEANVEVFKGHSTLSVVFHENYHADGPAINNAYRTFTFDTASGAQLELNDIVRPGIDPLIDIPTLGAPDVVEALDRAPPPHRPGTYPFTPDRWSPDNVYSGGYRAWALTPDSLIIYMPDYPVAHDVPVDYSPGMPVWSMDGGTVAARIPLATLEPVLRPEYS